VTFLDFVNLLYDFLPIAPFYNGLSWGFDFLPQIFAGLELGGWERFYFCFSLVFLPDDEKALA
jgi:hypothetical protein